MTCQDVLHIHHNNITNSTKKISRYCAFYLKNFDKVGLTFCEA